MATERLFAWGANSHGQLGLGSKSEQELVSEVCLPLNPQEIKEIGCGARHAIILDTNGDLFVTGKGELNDNSCSFTKIDLPIKVSHISCGWDVNAAISVDSRLFVWGNNSSGQLGFNNGIIREPQALTLPDNEIPLEMKFGLKHSAVLTKSNRILITGSLKHFRRHAENYQIMRHNSIEWLRVVMAADNDIITDFACGQNHVAFVIRNRIVCGIGDNKFGQCERIEAPAKVVSLESGWTHTAFLTDTNRLFLYGRNNYGQLGCGFKSADIIAEPRKCPITPVGRFSLGSEHCMLSSGGEIFTFGWNEHRNCGHDTDDDVLTPTRLPLSPLTECGQERNGKVVEKRIRLLAAGSGFCMVLVS